VKMTLSHRLLTEYRVANICIDQSGQDRKIFCNKETHLVFISSIFCTHPCWKSQERRR